MTNSIKNCIIVVAVFTAIGIVGAMDYNDEIREQIVYCENVKLNAWPDYNDNYESECTAEHLKEFSNVLR